MSDSPDLLETLFDWISSRGLTLYPAQEEAILELYEGKNVILNTPTGSGKSLVASALHRMALAQGRRSVYTCPIKALVNEKWLALCKEFGPENVGLSTGDATVNHDAPILCCTAEILANIALAQGDACTILDVVMDEFHYYSDKDRGMAWQVPLLTLPNSRFLLISATLGETSFFEEAMTRRNGLPSVTVRATERPVPLEFSYADTPLANTVQKLVHEGKAPVYVVHFTQADAARNAQNFTSLELCTKEEKASLHAALDGFRFSSPYGPDIKRWLRQGIGLHHAGLLPKYRILVERLAQKGLLKVICGTDTLGVGVNVPIRTVLFTQLCKYSGEKTAILAVRDFHQIAGRAGRKGFDNVGYVVAQAPEHVIENLQLAAKSAKTGKKYVKQKPPERGFVPWDEETYRKLIASSPEKLMSRFQVSHGTLLQMLSRETDGCKALKSMILESHEALKDKKRHRQRSMQLFRSLVERGVVEFVQNPIKGMAKVRVNAELQEHFSMDQTLSLYLLDTLPKLDVESQDYALDVLTLVEAILEDPELILRKQIEQVKNQLVAQLKAEGVEYEERMARLDEVEHPKPLRDFVYETFNAFAEAHPWVGAENIRPKSIVREMFEEYLTFSGYIKRYALERSEGLLLRHVNSVYKVLSNTVPQGYKTEAVQEIETYLEDMIARVDSSLLEEWERMRNPDFRAEEVGEALPPGAAEAAKDITRDVRKFTAAIRSKIFAFLVHFSRGHFEEALSVMQEDLPEGEWLRDGAGERWNPHKLAEAFLEYKTTHGLPRLDAEGRATRHTLVSEKRDENLWDIQQLLQDYQDQNDWCLDLQIDLSASAKMGQAVVTLMRIGELL